MLKARPCLEPALLGVLPLNNALPGRNGGCDARPFFLWRWGSRRLLIAARSSEEGVTAKLSLLRLLWGRGGREIQPCP